MNKNNFVNVVGYQFERVHTGIIKWILDTQNQSGPFIEQYKVIKRLFVFCQKPFHVRVDEIAAICCKPEYSFGRKRKIDLVIEITLITGIIKYVIIEMKVDSIPYEEQLSGTFEDFTNTVDVHEQDSCFMLFLFGSSQVCEMPMNDVFSICRVEHILDFFKDLANQDKIYLDWLESLEEESERYHNIMNILSSANDIWNEEFWKGHGYRPWFSLFYYFYHHLKEHATNPLEWNIYSGSNNPVMNWACGWRNLQYKGNPVLFYWEFNYQDFVLKMKVDEQHKLSRAELTALREEVAVICSQLDIKEGYKTQNRYGVYNSLYKWNYHFLQEDFRDIMNVTEEILAQVTSTLKSTYDVNNN